MKDPSLKEVIRNLIDEICVELEQEDSDCMMYSISSQICPEEQGDFQMRFNIDLEVILNEKPCSEKPTPCAKKQEIAEYIQRNLYENLPRHSSEANNQTPESRQDLHVKEEEALLAHDDE